MTHTVTDRFLRYVAIDTQSDPNSSTQPSTEKQKDLGRILVEELLEIGVVDAHIDENGYVYATIPSNVDKPVPVICFCSHMDTAPDFTGTNVKPQMVLNYGGGDIELSSRQIIRVGDNPALRDQLGNDIITTDGTTLLGADDKAGIAEIMTAAQFLVDNPDIRHGTIKLLFTTDEEIGREAISSLASRARPGGAQVFLKYSQGRVAKDQGPVRLRLRSNLSLAAHSGAINEQKLERDEFIRHAANIPVSDDPKGSS